MIYLDNAATSLPKPLCVRRAVAESMDKYNANPGRSGHRASVETSLAVYGVREKLAAAFGIEKPEHAVFTSGATHALNIAINCAVKPGTRVVTSTLEHNAVLRPLYRAKRERGCEIEFIRKMDGNDAYFLSKIASLVNKNCSAVILTARSNVTGEELPIKKVGKICRQNGVTFIVDASQAAGYKRINMTENYIDILCIPSHKGLFGICGAGAVIFSDEYRGKTDPLIYGGSGSFSESEHMPSLLPDALEAGTLPVPAILSMGAGIDFLNRVGWDESGRMATECADFVRKCLSNMQGVILYPCYGSIVLFNLRGLEPYRTAELLDESGIAVRSGLHCAPLCHRDLGTLPHGAVRASFNLFNTKKDAEMLVKRLRDLKKQ